MAYEATYDPNVETAMPEQRVRQMATRIKSRGTEAIEDSADWVRQNPGKTVLISILVGASLGAMIVNQLAGDDRSMVERRMDMLSDLSGNVWDKVSESAGAALCSVRDALSGIVSRYR
jgi:hypothetical protein